MITYLSGNIFDSKAEALVNPVNCVGVMGKGLALAFKERYPQNFIHYTWRCKHGQVRVGKMLFERTNDLFGPEWIINFPTKNDWREPSKYMYINEGLPDLLKWCDYQGISHVAMPALGCGNGGLDWDTVKEILERHLTPSLIRFEVYLPGEK
jgi:O-acetyl-ADP-ribose deacetylase (regulator of RNase III)